MLIVPFALVAFVCYRFWNQRRPTSESGRLERAGVLLGATGAIAMPWLWWSGVPEAALGTGVALAFVGLHRARSASPVR